jgi:hypothetical protein
MRKQFLLLVVFVFALAVSGAMAQSARHKTSTTTTTTTTTTTVTGPEHKIEGCIAKEQTDFFLIPQRGEPFRLQAAANQDIAGQEGHRVMVSGKWLNATEAQAVNGNTQSGSVAEQPAGTGKDLHRLSRRELVVDNVRSIADTCPVSWNPRASRQR